MFNTNTEETLLSKNTVFNFQETPDVLWTKRFCTAKLKAAVRPERGVALQMS